MRVLTTLALAAAVIGSALAIPAIARTHPHAGPGSPASPATLIPAAATATPTQHPGRRQPWTWPVTPPHIVRPFEPPAHRWEPGHRGVDLLAEPGQDVVAAGSGTVSFAGVLFGRPVVAVDHTAPGRDTLRTTYEPVDAVVKVGDHVKQGQLIGRLADDPAASHCAPKACLHWGLVRGFGHAEHYLDPAALLQKGPVRLLPVWSLR